MRVLDAEVNWREHVANDPVLELHVDEIPDRREMRFEHNAERGLWYGEHGGFVMFYSWKGPKNEGGFGGQHYRITTVEGEDVILKGPWSSRAGVMNKAGFGPCVRARITTDPAIRKSGHTGAVTLRVAKEAVDAVEDASHLQREIKFEAEPYWIVVPYGGER